MLAASIQKVKAEEFRRELARLHLVNKELLILEENEEIVIPLKQNPDDEILKRYGAKLTQRDFPERVPIIDPIEEIRRRVKIPDALKAELPDKWEIFGHVGVIRLGKELRGHAEALAEAYASVLKLSTILEETGPIQGEFRKPTTKLLYGQDTVTQHIENGIKYRFDAARIMFSSGNQEERLRMATIACEGETVVDMFAGIGYFCLPLAAYQNPRKVIAIEINPVAFEYLSENILLNGLDKVVEPVLGDNREFPGKDFADRIIMGYVKTTHEHLPAAMRMIKDGGIIHYHETCPNELLPRRPISRFEGAARGFRVEVLREKSIKSYAPGVSHVVLDVRVFKSS